MANQDTRNLTSSLNRPAPFPFADCAFFGLKSWRGNWRTVTLRLVVPTFILYLLFTLPGMFLMQDYFRAVGKLSAANETKDVAEILGPLRQIGMYWLFWMGSWLVAYSIGVNASFRWYLGGELKGQLGALRFGGDEVRTFLIALFYYFSVFVLPYLLLIMMVFAMGMLAGFAGMESKATGILVIAALVVGLLVMLVGMVLLAVRLSLCVPLSLERKKFVFWDSMRLTQKRGWALLGTYVIMLAINIVTMMMISTIGQMIMLGSDMGALYDPARVGDPKASLYADIADRMASPETFLPILGYSILSVAFYVFFLFAFAGLTAYSMRFLQEEKGDIVGNLEVFD